MQGDGCSFSERVRAATRRRWSSLIDLIGRFSCSRFEGKIAGGEAVISSVVTCSPPEVAMKERFCRGDARKRSAVATTGLGNYALAVVGLVKNMWLGAQLPGSSV